MEKNRQINQNWKWSLVLRWLIIRSFEKLGGKHTVGKHNPNTIGSPFHSCVSASIRSRCFLDFKRLTLGQVNVSDGKIQTFTWTHSHSLLGLRMFRPFTALLVRSGLQSHHACSLASSHLSTWKRKIYCATDREDKPTTHALVRTYFLPKMGA